MGDKIKFQQFDQSEISNRSNTWFVGSIGNIPDQFDPNSDFVDYYSEIKLPNKGVLFRLVKTAVKK